MFHEIIRLKAKVLSHKKEHCCIKRFESSTCDGPMYDELSLQISDFVQSKYASTRNAKRLEIKFAD